jgi:hypothetical protein
MTLLASLWAHTVAANQYEDAIERVVEGRAEHVQVCFEGHRAQSVEIGWTIEDGGTRDVFLHDPDHPEGPNPVGDCLVTLIEDWTFPEHISASVILPFHKEEDFEHPDVVLKVVRKYSGQIKYCGASRPMSRATSSSPSC